ncbi:MAG: hypothetical protein MHM6MM_003906 [Cercozoa sp. M6MM]
MSSGASISKIVIGTRKSDLALWQAYAVRDALQASNVSCEILGVSTLGDRVQNVPLSAFSDKGVFTKELDVALLDNTCQIAVHSMKDLPTTLPEKLTLAAVIPRGAVRDCLVIHPTHLKNGVRTLEDLSNAVSLVNKDGSNDNKPVIGTSSVRRRALLQRAYPNTFDIRECRGNLNTRTRKLDEAQFDAIVLAEAGLERLGWQNRLNYLLPLSSFPHAAAQGVVAVVAHEDNAEVLEACKRITCARTLLRVHSERMMLKSLEGGCKVPVACASAWTSKDGSDTDELSLHGVVVSPDGTAVAEFHGSRECHTLDDSGALGELVAEQLRQQGATAILDAVRASASGSAASS